MSDLHISHLPDRGIVRIAGSDARTFLQGIITNNVEKLSDNSALYSAFLTPQGKFLHDFFVIAQGDVLLLDCEGDRADDLVNRLARYRLRANGHPRATSHLWRQQLGTGVTTATNLPATSRTGSGASTTEGQTREHLAVFVKVVAA